MKQRTVALILVGFLGFLRVSELVALRAKDFKFAEEDQSFTVHIQRSKIDQEAKGADVLIDGSGGKDDYTVFGFLRNYWKALKLESDSFVFPSLQRTKHGHVARDRPISKNRARELLKDAAAMIGLPRERIGMHSLRSGGVTAASMNKVAERLLRKHGRWQSNIVKDSYIQETREVRLQVTKGLF